MSEEYPLKFGQCVVKRKIGEGAMAAVYLAEHATLQIPVAVKVPRVRPVSEEVDTEHYSERFMREARIAARLNHPNIVRVYDAGKEGDLYYMVLAYIEGPTLKRMLEEGGRFGWKDALRIIIPICDALRHAAREGVIHRDIKPDNIMMDRGNMPLLMDLGLAKVTVNVPSGLTETSDVLGTPFYMSPEQIRNPRNTDLRSDIYSLGATLYHMICGQPPFTGESIYDVMNQHLREPIVPPNAVAPDVPDSLCDIIAKTMAKAPADRYQEYTELIDDLHRTLAGEAVEAQGAHTALQTAVAVDAPDLAQIQADRWYRPSNLPYTFLAPAVPLYGFMALFGMTAAALMLYCGLRASVSHAAAWAFVLGAAAWWGLDLALAVLTTGSSPSADVADAQNIRLREVLNRLSTGLGLPVPTLHVVPGRKPARWGYVLGRRRAVIKVTDGFVRSLPEPQQLAEVEVLREIARLYYGHTAMLALIDGPLRMFRVAIKPMHWLLHRAGGSDSRGGRTFYVTLAILLAAAFAVVAGLLVWRALWAGLAVALFLVAGLLGQALRRHGEYAADLFAAAVVHDQHPVRRLIVDQALADAPEARLLRRAAGIPVPSQDPTQATEDERLQIMNSLTITRWRGGPGDALREFLTGWPAAALRLNAMAGLIKVVPAVHRFLRHALQVIGAFIGSQAERRELPPAPEPVRVAPYVVLGMLAGLLTVCVFGVTGVFAPRAAANYFAFLGMVGALAVALGIVDASMFRVQQGTRAELACSVIVSVFCMMLVGLALLTLLNATAFGFLMPVVLVPAVAVAVASAALWARLLRVLRPLQIICAPQTDERGTVSEQ